MKQESVVAIVNGLIEAGINFVALMPDSEFAKVQAQLHDHPDIRCVSVSNEAIGVALCAGAWLGGKMPALLIPTAGLLVASWPLASICMAWGLPIILIIPYRGEMGDGFWVMRPYHYTTKRTLTTLQIPYSVVGKVSEVKEAISAARRSAAGWLHPTALILTGEVVW